MNDLAQYNWRKVLIRGQFLPLSSPDQPSAILIGPRVYEGEGGYHLILPFLRSPNPDVPHNPSDPPPAPILVNLGFVTEAVGKAGPNAIHIPVGEVELEGMMRTEGSGEIAQKKKGKKPTLWTPDNEPEERNWYWTDVAEFAEYYSTPAVGEVLPVLCDSVYGSFCSLSLLWLGHQLRQATLVDQTETILEKPSRPEVSLSVDRRRSRSAISMAFTSLRGSPSLSLRLLSGGRSSSLDVRQRLVWVDMEDSMTPSFQLFHPFGCLPATAQLLPRLG